MRLAAAVGAALVVLPSAATAHDAFGDIGPFYNGLLHPLVDPAQALSLTGLAVLMAIHPIGIVRIAVGVFITFAVGTLVASQLTALVPQPVLLQTTALATGLTATAGPRIPAIVPIALASVTAVLSIGNTDQPTSGLREILLFNIGTLVGHVFFLLLLWELLEQLVRRLGPLACRVAGSWVAAIAILTLALASLRLEQAIAPS